MRLGFDEVGRGALAGPVAVSLVAIPENWPLKIYAKSSPSEQRFLEQKHPILKKVNDSKKVASGVRASIAEYVRSSGLIHIILQGSNRAIDRFGIGKVLSHLLGIGIELMANQIEVNTPLKVYIDGRIKLAKLDAELIHVLLEENELNTRVNTDILTQQMKTDLFSGFEKFVLIREDKADEKYLPVALASNVAKVYRDTIMAEYAAQYPEFGWEQNVGYGTKSHREAIKLHPNNPLLRSTWLKKILES